MTATRKVPNGDAIGAGVTTAVGVAVGVAVGGAVGEGVGGDGPAQETTTASSSGYQVQRHHRVGKANTAA